MTTEVVESVWEALEETPTEAENMKLRSILMIAITETVTAWHVTQIEAARRLGVTQPRLNDLLRGRVGKFSLDALVALAARASRCIWKSHWPHSQFVGRVEHRATRQSVPFPKAGLHPPYACCAASTKREGSCGKAGASQSRMSSENVKRATSKLSP